MKAKAPLLTLAILGAGFLALPAQTALPYFTGFDNTQGQAGWTKYKKISTTSSSWDFISQPPPQAYAAYSTPSCTAHFYPVGDLTLDWLVSPSFNFSAGGKIDSVRHAFSGFSPTPLTSDTVAVFLLKGSPDPDLATAKIELLDFRNANYVSDNVWRIATNIIIPPTPGLSYIAFKYRASSSWLDVRFDNLRLSGNGAPPSASFSATANNSCKGEKIVFSDLSTNTPTAWSWQFPGGTPSVSAISNPTVIFNTPGIYTVTLVSSNGFGAGNSAPGSMTVNICTALPKSAQAQDAIIFPNPTTGKFTFRFEESETGNFRIGDVYGKEIFSGQLTGNTLESSSLNDQPAGIYFLSVNLKNSQRTYKIIKE